MPVFEQWDTVRSGAGEGGGCCSWAVSYMAPSDGAVSAGPLGDGGSYDEDEESY